MMLIIQCLCFWTAGYEMGCPDGSGPSKENGTSPTDSDLVFLSARFCFYGIAVFIYSPALTLINFWKAFIHSSTMSGIECKYVQTKTFILAHSKLKARVYSMLMT